MLKFFNMSKNPYKSSGVRTLEEKELERFSSYSDWRIFFISNLFDWI